MQMVRNIVIAVTAAFLCGCGTEVDVGRNDQPELFQVEDNPQGSTGNADATAGAALLSCQDTLDAKGAPKGVDEFCASAPAKFRGSFAKAFDLLCESQKALTMSVSGCAWDGSKDMNAFFRVFEKTDLTATSIQEFTFVAGSAVEIPRHVSEYENSFYKGYEDPEFKAKLKKLDSFKLSNVEVDRNAGTIDYFVEAQTSAATAKFTGHIDVVKFPSGAMAIFDEAVADKVIVKENRYMILVLPTGENRSIVLAIDDKVVDDLGNHQIAYNTSVKVNKQRMELTHATGNMQVQSPP
jgi:hypothetical protein